MTVPVSITGLGLVTALGNTAPASWDALLAGRFITDHASCCTGVPPVSDFSRKNPGKMPVLQQPRVCMLATQAAREAIAEARWIDDRRTALIVGTSKGPIESWIAGGDVRLGLSAVAESLSPLMRFTAATTLSAACASGLHALIRATMMLQNGEADRALVVAAEASVHPLFLGSFQRLGVLARPEIGCRPFDETREGFLMSEAAAAVCLERNANGNVAIDRFAMGGDVTSLIASDADAVTLHRLLAEVVRDGPVDLIHAHGTATVANDAIELNAVERTVGTGSLYSHKGALGHSLGAAGLVSVVINVLAHRYGIVPPNARTDQAMSSSLSISRDAKRRDIKRSIAIASGFGGPIAVLRMRSL